MACTQTFWVSDCSSQVFHYNYSYFAAPFSDALVKKNSSSPVDLVPVTVQITSAYYNRRTVSYAKGLILYNTFLSSQTMFF